MTFLVLEMIDVKYVLMYLPMYYRSMNIINQQFINYFIHLQCWLRGFEVFNLFSELGEDVLLFYLTLITGYNTSKVYYSVTYRVLHNSAPEPSGSGADNIFWIIYLSKICRKSGLISLSIEFTKKNIHVWIL